MRIPVRGSIALLLFLIALTGRSQSDAQSSAPPKDAAKAAPGAIKPLPVTVAKAEARDVQRSVETVGILLAWDDVQVRTEQPGTIARLFADLGDSVVRGQMHADRARLSPILMLGFPRWKSALAGRLAWGQ